MEKLSVPKRFTQSITGILVVTIVLVTAVVIGKGMEATGLIASIDRSYSNRTWFWAMMVVSRLLFALVWGAGDYFLVNVLSVANWLWFKPEKKRYSYGEPEEERDKSSEIVAYVVLLVFAFLVAEFAIRLISHTNPPYFLPRTD